MWFATALRAEAIVEDAAVMGETEFAGAANSGGRTTLFRAVSPAELDDLQATKGILRNPPGIENKYFSETAEGAAYYAQQAFQRGGRVYEGPYTIIKSEVHSELITPIMRVTPDRGIPTVVLPSDVLPKMTPAQPLPFTPLPSGP
jgi:hypothetical protein